MTYRCVPATEAVISRSTPSLQKERTLPFCPYCGRFSDRMPEPFFDSKYEMGIYWDFCTCKDNQTTGVILTTNYPLYQMTQIASDFDLYEFGEQDFKDCFEENFFSKALLTENGDILLPTTAKTDEVARYVGFKFIDPLVSASFKDDFKMRARKHPKEVRSWPFTPEKSSPESSRKTQASEVQMVSPSKLTEQETPEVQAASPSKLTEQETLEVQMASHSKPMPQERKSEKMNTAFDFSMHPLEDENVAGTLLGVAVKVDNSWRIYDKEKGVITDLGEIQFGNFPLWVIPAFRLSSGDIILDAGKYYCVTGQGKRVQTIDIATGREHNIVPVKNILGFNVYQKVMAITDVLGFDVGGPEGLSDEQLLLLTMVMGQASSEPASNNQMNSLLPLLLLGGNNQDMGELQGNKLLLLALMSSGGTDSANNQGNLMQLLVLKKLLGSELGLAPGEKSANE